ncbi:MAG: archaemetzincin family Zn-dependent metalloprotease [Candidatus Aenigmatarchaeota archaeon]
MLIRIIPVGNPPQKILETIKASLPDIFNSEVRMMPALDVPQDSYNHWRKQYNAEKIIDILSKEKAAKFIDRSIPSLFIIDQDIYYDGLNFVFGVEDPIHSSAIISLTRLKPEFYGKGVNLLVLSDRAVKEAVHEIGHHLGLGHCRHPFCVMAFSPSVEDVDNKQRYFCRDCKVRAATRGISLE